AVRRDAGRARRRPPAAGHGRAGHRDRRDAVVGRRQGRGGGPGQAGPGPHRHPVHRLDRLPPAGARGQGRRGGGRGRRGRRPAGQLAGAARHRLRAAVQPGPGARRAARAV
ncbi:MAG: hypothetical protein AVDCRST_MAG16-1781, partial [uncultured Frankineae bacterium]